MQRVLITGGSGFIGTNLLASALARGDRVLNVDIAPPRNPAHAPHWRAADIRDRDALRAAVQGFAPDLLVHLAARTDLKGRRAGDYDANTTGVRNLVEAAEGVPRILLASSMLVCELGYLPRHDRDFRPTTAYGRSKAEGEEIVRRDGDRLAWTIVRPTSIWGPWFAAPYRDFFAAIAKGRYFHPRGRRIERTYGFVGNVVHQIEALARAPEAQVRGCVFYVADYEPLEIGDFGARIADALRAPRIRTLPLPLLRAGALAGDLLDRVGLKAPLTSFRLKNLLTHAVYDLAPTRAVCGPCPFDLAEGVRRTAEWLTVA